jgi:hypothetical protein
MLSAPFGRTRLLGAFALAVGLSPLGWGQTVLDDTLSSLEQWVEMERRIASESAAWEVERESLQDLLGLYREELAGLRETIREAEEEVNAAEAARAELNEESERLSHIEERVAAAIVQAELDLKALNSRLPEPLQKQIQPLFAQLPSNPRETSLSLAQRIQFIAGMLTQIQKFNTTVTVLEDFRVFEEGNLVQIDAIYFGLGTAYYVDKGNLHAGFAVLGPDGWRWNDDVTLAPLVREVIDIYKSPGKAAFVELPVQIQ